MDNNASSQKLRFRVLECSSEDSQHSASELLSGSPQSKGWQSQRFCAYPQYMTLQFLSPVNLKQLQLLFHEVKIPTKLELFLALPDMRSPLPYSEIKFKKLGHLAMDSNEKTSFQLRELKTIYIDAPCLYLRIVFHKCHVNKLNFFNQVGLINLIAFGEPMDGSSPKKPLKIAASSANKQDKNEHDTELDELTQIKISELEEAKLRAIENEEFDEAQRIKRQLAEIQQIGGQLKRFEERKAAAIKNEDFEAAKVCKREIARLKESITGAITGRSLNKQGSHSHLRGVGTQNSLNRQASKENLTTQRADRPDTMMSGHKAAGVGLTPRDRYAMRNEPTEDDFEEAKDEDEDENSYPGRYSHGGQASRKQLTGREIPFDDQVIPTLAKKNTGGFEEDMQAAANMAEEAEELTPANQKKANPLIPAIGREMCKKIFSKHWNLREEGLQTLIIEVPRESSSKVLNDSDPWALFVAVMGAVSYTIGDRINQVSGKAMLLLKLVLSKKLQNAGTKNEMIAYVDTMLNGLLEKIGDNNVKIREQAEDALVYMAQNPHVTCSFVVNGLLRENANPKSKAGQSAKHVLGKLKVIEKLVGIFKINNSDVPYQPVMEFCVEKLEHPNVDVRTSVINLLTEIYLIMGKRVQDDLSGIRPAQLEIIQNEFNAAMASNSKKQNPPPAAQKGKK